MPSELVDPAAPGACGTRSTSARLCSSLLCWPINTTSPRPSASRVLATRTQPSPVVLAGLDAVIATLLAGGLSPGLIHQVMHTLGSRLWGFNVEVFPSPPPPADPADRERLLAQLGAVFPHVLVVAGAARHRQDAIVGDGCDDNAEFAFGIDLVLDGIERLHRAEAASPQPPG